MKIGDLVIVSGFTSVLGISNQIGLVLEIFVKDNAAWVLFPNVGKSYVNLSSLKKVI
tara:strand:+ start:547 stop:717 length:171 start_codon:yes stop_codon:yes gene_type:complete